jgi:hypothetical protein
MDLNSSIVRELESMRCETCGKSPVIYRDSIECCCAPFREKVMERMDELIIKGLDNDMESLFKR